MKRMIQIVSAPSILGLKPNGVERLAESLLSAGLAEKLQALHPVVHVQTLNEHYRFDRDVQNHCLNPAAIHSFSLNLIKEISKQLNANVFPIVLGGDCSILMGILPAMKELGNCGLVFLDAHADFYEPEKSTTGQVADMDLAIVTGRGPDTLTNINGLKPYVKDKYVIHIGQRDAAEAARYGSQDIADTAIRRFDMSYIHLNGINRTTKDVISCATSMGLKRFWLHFDTDVLHDDENPAVDYRLPGGLRMKDTGFLIHSLLKTDMIAGMSVTIFNPSFDTDGSIREKIVDCILRAFTETNE